MPRTRDKTLYERVFDIESLPDEIREEVLSKLTVSELMAFECVSRRCQKNVVGILSTIQVVDVSIRGLAKVTTAAEFFSCGTTDHRMSNAAKIVIRDHHQEAEPVLRLITKMSNLVAVCLPASWQSVDSISTLANCSKLKHLEFTYWRDDDEVSDVKIPQSLLPQLTCLSSQGKLSHETIKEMTLLKQFHYHDYHLTPIPLDHLITLLDNGLIGLNGTIEYVNFDELCNRGRRLESLEFEIFADADLRKLTSSDVRQMVRSLRRLKKLKINFSLTDVTLLNGLKNLEDLTLMRVPIEEAHLFKDAMAVFGHRIKALGFLFVNNILSVIGDVADVCPNLESLNISGSGMVNDPAFELAALRKLSKLRTLKFDFYHWSDEDILELLDHLPNLRKVEGEVDKTGDELETFKNLVKQKFPALDFDFD